MLNRLGDLELSDLVRVNERKRTLFENILCMERGLRMFMLFVCCVISSLTYSQENLPNKIKVQYYLGGDYSDSAIRGIIEDVYELEYDYNQASGLFLSKQLDHRHQVYDWDRKNLDNYRLVEDSTITIYDEMSIKVEAITELLAYTERDNYMEWELIDTVGVPFPLIDSAIVIRDFTLKDIGIDSSYFFKACGLYRRILIDENIHLYEDVPSCDKDLDFSELVHSFISQSNTDWIMSSYSIWIRVQLIFENGNEIIVKQSYPGGFNIGWDIEQGNLAFRAINPHMNRTIANFMQSRYTQLERRLLRFEDLKQLVRFYLMGN